MLDQDPARAAEQFLRERERGLGRRLDPTVCGSRDKGFSLRGEGAVTRQYRLALRAGLAVSHSVPRPGVVSPDARVRRVSVKTSVRARPYLGVVSRRRVSQKAGIRCELFPEGCSSCWWRCVS
jgi:hypothetical protein